MVVIYTVTFDLLISGASLPDGTTNKQSQESLRGVGISLVMIDPNCWD